MEFDQTYNGAPVDWNFPSPTATPTHNSFGNNIFQTPKTGSFPSNFQDALATPQFGGFTTPQPLQNPTITPIQRPQTSSDTLRSNYYANLHAVGGQNNGQGMLPPGQNAPNMVMYSPTYHDVYSQPQFPVEQAVDVTQVQTPPPTRGTSAKRMQQAQQIAFGTPSTIASRRFMTPQQPSMPVDSMQQFNQTPIHFPQLQFSPDMYQFANLGPASAPVMPQTRILWDQSTSPIQPIPTTSLEDPFAPGLSNPSWHSNMNVQQQTIQPEAFNTPAMNSFSVQTAAERTTLAKAWSGSRDPANDRSASAVGVDPSLLYSSPLKPPVRSNNKLAKVRSQSFAEDKQRQSSAPLGHTRSETNASTRSASALYPSNSTHTFASKSMTNAANGIAPLIRSSSFTQITRTASPAKRLGRAPLGSISEGRPRQRTSVILTVDEHGIARTETKHIDRSPTRAMRERYPALFDSDSSDAETEVSDKTPSRPLSFIFDKRDERKSKAARLDPPVENLEGLTLPRSGSANSIKKGIPPSRAAVAAAAQLRTQGSFRRSTSSRNSRRNAASRSSSSLIDTAPMDTSSSTGQEVCVNDDDDFDLAPSSAESTLDMHNRRWSMMSFEQHNSQSHSASTSFQQSNIAQIHCACGVTNDNGGQRLVKCTSCSKWVHAYCVGLQNQRVPANFNCFICTNMKNASRSSGNTDGSTRRSVR